MPKKSRAYYHGNLENMKKGGCLLKKICWICLKFILLFIFIISSSLAIYMHYKGATFDPIREIQRLKSENRRDDALDLVRFFKENQLGDQDKFARIEKALEYTAGEKIKSFVWDGSIRGQVYDLYSGMGAISADLCVLGEIRDLGIQGWKYLTDSDDFDRFIFILSAAGIGLSTTPFINGTNALAKGILKYLKQLPSCLNKGVLKVFLAGKLHYHHAEKLWDLLKKTTGRFPAPYPAYQT